MVESNIRSKSSPFEPCSATDERTFTISKVKRNSIDFGSGLYSPFLLLVRNGAAQAFVKPAFERVSQGDDETKPLNRKHLNNSTF
jgi:hypothetical protein